ncbi:glycoside hydrolase family 13 protein [Arthrobacter echini]|uniref:Glycoside hydrolase family 13 protein n=1 Tax=Arthrobacter echini TaxID=1529066 RepID=A0A4S5E9T0_9MICC|nr:alpha-amylase family glycosyl hydrolase [Arthrobacter echini]THJ68465.1 glycoside hydrolase family 13 protein [Arthrobacter echini]
MSEIIDVLQHEQLPVRTAFHEPLHVASGSDQWWRRSVIYQVYPRSFRDSNGDGVGDLPGIASELARLAELSVDAVWLSPFYTSPQRDGGYDVADYCDVDPLFGTLTDFDTLVAEADRLGIRVIVDLVPNHCSSEHALFRAALAAPAGSPEREMFIFRDGTGTAGEEPPNNWQSHFGGPAWTRILDPDGTPGQWYLHLFDSSQPDFNWDNPAVHAEFERVLRFWLDRGVGGFRVDVAHALIKAEGLPDWGGRPDGGSTEGYPGWEAPMFGQDGVHAIFRRWRSILAEYDGERILCAEASIDPLARLTDWVRPDEMHQAFNFAYLHNSWNAHGLRSVVSASLAAFDTVGAPTTWVLSNHDVVRHTSRFGLTDGSPRGGDGIGSADVQPDTVTGLTRARAASLAMFALPGGIYLYQGEELGLPDHTSMPDDARQDPTFARTGGERLGRDGCRVPLPWRAQAPAFGFIGTDDADSAGNTHDAGATGTPWLPQPESWGGYARDLQSVDQDSTLTLYRTALQLRRDLRLGAGSLSWSRDFEQTDVVAFRNGEIIVVLNMGGFAVPLPEGAVVAASMPDAVLAGQLAPDACVWLMSGADQG